MKNKPKNKNLQEAKNTKNDEFYTQLKDIEREVSHYKDQLKDKIIYCNCDNPEWSNFWKYFKDNFKDLGIKKLISTYYEVDEKTYKTIYDGKKIIKTELNGNGDFRSDECLEILKASDIIITNPPFSLLKEYIPTLVKINKKFLIIGTLNSAKYKEVFNYIKEDKLWLGYGFKNGNAYFNVPPNEENQYAKGVYDEKTGLVKFRNCIWLTNMDNKRKHENLPILNDYKFDTYSRFDNYKDIINIDKLKLIPKYKGKMAVPITFFQVYNPYQFKIVDKISNGIVNDKKIYERIIITMRT